jgi:hypothetical protein
MENPRQTPGCARARGEVPEWLVWCTGQIRRQPLTALGLGATLGFLLGGGTRSSLGRRVLVVAGKSLLGGAVGGLVSELLEEHDRESVRTSTGTEAGAR